ncbi:hypothetical protein F751_4317 [Auxenochlorella protothecoides]|uniref:Uncharacterized protein n=1 Tax=Auxenochlorella protothecoides TaxID=3075 RepID=A0A087SSY8_AUXPR|nr:hypothetical protein F751_4317 [Auxenochlorella protothecoides]KFM28842.1 hypothetical protein F751_4317 [Auxenochlorella protothecoides]
MRCCVSVGEVVSDRGGHRHRQTVCAHIAPACGPEDGEPPLPRACTWRVNTSLTTPTPFT